MADVVKFGSAAMLGGQETGQSGLFGMGENSVIARVTFILLDDSNKEKFDRFGGWKALGTIECVPYINGADSDTVIVARPIDTHFTKYPVITELVRLKKGVSSKSQGGSTNYSPEWYYVEVLSTWNAVEHNATPDSILLKNKYNQKPYSETTIGHTAKDNTKENLDITGDFKDTGKVRKLIKAPGDLTVEGRSGNTIRLGSYIESFKSPISGKDRSPLIMIVNGQRNVDINIPIFEDVNKDGSSLYLLNGQTVNFIPSSVNFDSFNMKVDTNVKSNYIEPVIIPDVPVSQSANQVDSNTKTVDTKPESIPVANAVKTNDVVAAEEDLKDLPSREQPIQFVQETDDIVKTKQTQGITTTPEKDRAGTSNTGGFLQFYDVPFQVQKNQTFCFVACISMLFDYLKVTAEHGQMTIAKKYTDNSGNLYPSEVAKLANPVLSYRYFPIDNVTGYQAIIDKLKSFGKPIIVERKSITKPNDQGESHFVVVTGIDSSGLLRVNDPSNSDEKSNKNKLLLPADLKAKGSIRLYN